MVIMYTALSMSNYVNREQHEENNFPGKNIYNVYFVNFGTGETIVMLRCFIYLF